MIFTLDFRLPDRDCKLAYPRMCPEFWEGTGPARVGPGQVGDFPISPIQLNRSSRHLFRSDPRTSLRKKVS
jgi:hypothetical protein